MLRKGSQEAGAAACTQEVRKKEEEDTEASVWGLEVVRDGWRGHAGSLEATRTAPWLW